MGRRKIFKSSAATFRTGAIALAFLVALYQSALFVHRAAALRIEAHRDKPDTVFVVDEDLARRVLSLSDSLMPESVVPEGKPATAVVTVRSESAHSEAVKRQLSRSRKVESFRFNPNTASLEELCRLGFSDKQAGAIIAYRQKGGRFRRPSDFAKSYVVADSVFRRLEPFIVIPKLDINKADSAAFDSLPGIGGKLSSRMVSYRTLLGGYSCVEQLLEVYGVDEERFSGFSDLVFCSAPDSAFALWSGSADKLRAHPYINSWQTARSIVLFRETTPSDQWTVAALENAGILDSLSARRLSRCRVR